MAETNKTFSIEEIKAEFGQTISYNQIIDHWTSYSPENQEEIQKIIDEKQQKFWEEYTSFYAYFFPKLPFVPEHIKHFVEELNPRDNEVILDLGCGYGRLINKIFEKNQNVGKVIGIDYAENMIRKAKEIIQPGYLSKTELKNEDVSKKISLPDNSVDKIISNWGIFYFSKHELNNKTFPEIRRVLKPNGKLITSAIVKGSDLPGLRKKMSFFRTLKILVVVKKAISFGKDIKMYFPAYSPEEMMKIIQMANFRIISHELTLYKNSVTIIAENTKA